MGIPLRTLIIEDSVDDALLLVRALQKGDFDPAYERVETAEAMREALERQAWDVIISDYKMPLFSGLEALKLYKEKGADIPFIIVSGTIGEEVAVATMISGAHDYVMKDNLPRLVHAVRRELKEAEARRKRSLMAKAIEYNEERFKELFEHMSSAVAMYKAVNEGEDFIFTGFNKAAEKIENISRERLLGKSVLEVFPGVKNMGLFDVFQRVYKTGRPEQHPIAFYKDQRVSGWKENYVYKLSSGEIVAIYDDVTEKKISEQFLKESEEKYRRIVDTAYEGIHVLDDQAIITFTNQRMSQMMGYEPEEFIGRKIQSFLYEEDASLIEEQMDRRRKGMGGQFERRYRRKDGSTLWTHVSSTPIMDEQHRFHGSFAMLTDITERKQAENRQQLVNDILEALNSPNEVANLVRRILGFLKNYTGIEAMGIRLIEGEDYPYIETNGFSHSFIEKERYLCARDEYNEIIRDEKGNPYIECMCGNIISGRTDYSLPFFTEGGSFWTNSTSKLLASTSEGDRQSHTRNSCNSEGYESVTLIPLRSGEEIVGLLQMNDTRPDCFTLDMIKFFEGIAASIGIAVSRKQAQEAVKISEGKYRRIVETAREGMAILDENFTFTFVNTRFAEMLGYGTEEVVGRDPVDFTFEEDIPVLSERRKRQRQGDTVLFERRYRHKDGSAIWAYVSITPIIDETGRFQGSFSMHTDITQRKLAEEALKKSEEQYRSIFKNALEGICQVAPEGHFITVNPAMARIYGYESPGELIASVTDIAKQLYVNPEERAQYKKLLEEHGVAKNFEHRSYRKDGDIIWVSLTTRLIKDASGKALYFDTMVEDITRRKEAEEELRWSEEKYRSIFENATEGIYQSTPEGRFISVNPAMAHIYGYESPEEMMVSITHTGKQLYIDQKERLQYKNILDEYGVVNNFETQSPKKDGDIIWVSLSARAVKDDKGKTLYYDGIVEDITSRKMAEGILKQTLEKLRRSLVGTIQVMSMTTEIRDPYTAGHQRKVSNLARLIAQEMGLPDDTVDNIRMAGTIHDLGKMAVPAEILSKPSKLTDMEMGLIKVHSQAGYDILKEAELPYPIAEIVLQHHERVDGSGYPQGLKNGQILLESQIIAVADVVEAISSHRPYRPAKGIEAALEEIENNKGILYDEKVADVCVKLFREKGFKFE